MVWIPNLLRAETLEQVIVRENPAFKPAVARLTVGRDGMVYLCNGEGGSSFVLRLSRDGKDRRSKVVGHSGRNATANAAGVVATAHGHFAHKVTLHSPALTTLASFDEFLVNDRVGWDAPGHVEAGASGDFYGLDQHRERILRVSPEGKLVQSYAIPHEPKGVPGQVQEFRVCEGASAFYLLARSGPIRCVGFDGKTRWTAATGVTWQEFSNNGGFDVDDDGRLYALEAKGDTIRRVSPAGKPLEAIKLQMGAHKAGPREHGVTDLRIHGTDLLVKRKHDTELFRRYDLVTSKLVQVVSSDHERLTVTFPSNVWTAGQALPFRVQLTGSGPTPAPRWRVWARLLNDVEYQELPLIKDQLRVPAGCAGLYQIKVTPEVQPWQRGTAAEYQIKTIVEIRSPNTHGTATVFTPDNRTSYGQGEEIPVSVLVRTAKGKGADEVTLRLSDGSGTLAAGKVNGKALHSLTLPSTLTRALRPGRYVLTATAPGLTGVAQPLEIGPGLSRSPFHLVQYGDYAPLYLPTSPNNDVWAASDLAKARASRTAKLGVTLMVDRLGDLQQLPNLSLGQDARAELTALERRLRADPDGVAPEKGRTSPLLLQTLAGYGAAGVEQMAILMMNDAGLPLGGGSGFDPRKPDQLTETITQTTKTLRPYPAFRGWSWAANWWVFQNRGAQAARGADEKTAYEAAVKRARETGVWDGVLDRVSDTRFGYAVEAQALFHKALGGVDPKLTTASAPPYRNVDAYPPATFANVDEVDLHAQWEQIALPYHAPYGVDFYKRPGKRAWAHSEVWNDPGTGEQIGTTLFQAVMRGADGVGFTGPMPPWGAIPDDDRLSYAGTASVCRALGKTFREYGPWLTTLRNNDRVAIVCSSRMYRIDEYTRVMGTHFARVMEAYCSCLHAHHPASIVFVEDLKPDLLKRFKAVLIVGQTVEMEPALADALKTARANGLKVFHDGTCRPSLVKGLTPLGVSFNKFEKDAAPASDDAAYWRFAEYCRTNAVIVAKVLGTATPPVARVDNPEVFVSERQAEEGRYLFVVNNATPDLKPGHLWRVSLGVASRRPVVARVGLSDKPGFVYDVLAGKRIEADKGVIEADCRSVPARIYAMLPAAIGRVVLIGPEAVRAGQSFAWKVAVEDADGQPIRASIPIRLRLLTVNNELIEERFTAAGSAGAAGTMTAVINVPLGALTLEATELLSGQSASLALTVTLDSEPVPLGKTTPALAEAPAKAVVRGKEIAPTFAPAETAFGPHVRDVIVTDNGALAVMNTMNWDHNLYAVEVDTGRLRWRQRVGQYFAFAPRPTRTGFAVQGFDFRSAEGYHLYLAGADGKPERRFALYGLPKRLTHRFVPGLVQDRINQFAVAEDGRWVASAGDLGLAVWNRDGKLLWSQDWWKTRRHTATLTALGSHALLVVEGVEATAYDPMTGKPIWEVKLPAEGELRDVRVSQDGHTCALASTAEGGRVYVLVKGKLLRTFPTGATALALSPDGSHLAVAATNQLKLYSVADGLRWVLPADDALHFPRFAPDGKRLVATSELGSVYVLGLDGTLLHERDAGALAVPAWLPDGDLLLGTWMGTVCRLDRSYKERWRTRLDPEATRTKLLGDERTPTIRIANWGNAEATPAKLLPNLLSPSTVTVQIRSSVPAIQWTQSTAALTDGKRDAPPQPWLHWHDVGWFAKYADNYLQIDTYRAQLRVTGITLAEDPAHPESWLRDATFEYWDPSKERWVVVQSLLSNSALHTHKFAKPVEASRFRLGLPWGLYGNLRLAEIVLHGQKLGPSHPDVLARRPVAVLFDEGEDLKDVLVGHLGLAFQTGGAYSGVRYLSLAADADAFPGFNPNFGHALPNWDFEIVEKPKPGQYRYLQFAWRATKPTTKGIVLRLGPVACYAGERKPDPETIPRKVADAPPGEWRVERIDLWQVLKKPTRIQSLRLASYGGPAAFDQILLGRTEKDLPDKGK